MHYRYRETPYLIQVRQVEPGSDESVAGVKLDGVAQDGLSFPLVDDGALHQVEVIWPRAQS
ncbi:hypothetical protein D3C71_2226020 [compost metagenome]